MGGRDFVLEASGVWGVRDRGAFPRTESVLEVNFGTVPWEGRTVNAKPRPKGHRSKLHRRERLVLRERCSSPGGDQRGTRQTVPAASPGARRGGPATSRSPARGSGGDSGGREEGEGGVGGGPPLQQQHQLQQRPTSPHHPRRRLLTYQISRAHGAPLLPPPKCRAEGTAALGLDPLLRGRLQCGSELRRLHRLRARSAGRTVRAGGAERARGERGLGRGSRGRRPGPGGFARQRTSEDRLRWAWA